MQAASIRDNRDCRRRSTKRAVIGSCCCCCCRCGSSSSCGGLAPAFAFTAALSTNTARPLALLCRHRRRYWAGCCLRDDGEGRRYRPRDGRRLLLLILVGGLDVGTLTRRVRRPGMRPVLRILLEGWMNVGIPGRQRKERACRRRTSAIRRLRPVVMRRRGRRVVGWLTVVVAATTARVINALVAGRGLMGALRVERLQRRQARASLQSSARRRWAGSGGAVVCIVGRPRAAPSA